MKFVQTPIAGAFVLELEPHGDDRGSFSRSYCIDEFAKHDIEMPVVQGNLARTTKKGTMRGLHYQVAPAAEAKLMRCVRGSVYDVLVDLRKDSPTYLEHFGIELSADNGLALYVPPLFGHGYQSLQDDVEMFYLVSEFYTPGAERGARYDDPAFGIQWPVPVDVISEKDLAWDPFDPEK